MKATGIIRRVDDLGRVVIPKEIRRSLHIREGEPLEIYIDHDGSVIFRKLSHDLVDDVKHLEEVLDAYLPIDSREEQVYLKNLLGQVLEIVKRNVEECED